MALESHVLNIIQCAV